MTEPKLPEHEADDDARYYAQLVRDGVPPEIAAKMVCARIAAKLVGNAIKPKKEPWEP